MTLDQKLKKLAKVCDGLSSTEERPIARRNARARVLSALRAVRAHVDATYPPIVDRTGTRRLTPQGRMDRLKRRGFVQVTMSVAATLTLAGVKIHTVRVPNVQQSSATITVERYFAPRWAVYAETHYGVEELRRQVKNKSRRLALQAEAAILQSN